MENKLILRGQLEGLVLALIEQRTVLIPASMSNSLSDGSLKVMKMYEHHLSKPEKENDTVNSVN